MNLILNDIPQECIEQCIKSEVCYFLQHNIKYNSDRWPYQATGDKAINYIFRDAIAEEVQTYVRAHIDKIVKKSIQQTAQSIRNNPHYDDLRIMISEILMEEDAREDSYESD